MRESLFNLWLVGFLSFFFVISMQHATADSACVPPLATPQSSANLSDIEIELGAYKLQFVRWVSKDGKRAVVEERGGFVVYELKKAGRITYLHTDDEVFYGGYVANVPNWPKGKLRRVGEDGENLIPNARKVSHPPFQWEEPEYDPNEDYG